MAKQELSWVLLWSSHSVGHPQEAWTPSAFGSLKAASPCPSLTPAHGEGCRDTSPSEPSSAWSSWVTRGPVGSAATSQEPPQPAGIVSLPLGIKAPQESNISCSPFGEASYFLDDFAGAATVDLAAISVTAVDESSSNWSCTTHCPSGQP